MAYNVPRLPGMTSVTGVDYEGELAGDLCEVNGTDSEYVPPGLFGQGEDDNVPRLTIWYYLLLAGLAPTMGSVCDRMRLRCGLVGRRRICLLFGGVVAASGSIVATTVCQRGEAVAHFYMYFVTNLGTTMTQTILACLLIDVVPRKRRGLGAGLAAAFALLGEKVDIEALIVERLGITGFEESSTSQIVNVISTMLVIVLGIFAFNDGPSLKLVAEPAPPRVQVRVPRRNSGSSAAQNASKNCCSKMDKMIKMIKAGWSCFKNPVKFALDLITSHLRHVFHARTFMWLVPVACLLAKVRFSVQNTKMNLRSYADGRCYKDEGNIDYYKFYTAGCMLYGAVVSIVGGLLVDRFQRKAFLLFCIVALLATDLLILTTTTTDTMVCLYLGNLDVIFLVTQPALVAFTADCLVCDSDGRALSPARDLAILSLIASLLLSNAAIETFVLEIENFVLDTITGGNVYLGDEQVHVTVTYVLVMYCLAVGCVLMLPKAGAIAAHRTAAGLLSQPNCCRRRCVCRRGSWTEGYAHIRCLCRCSCGRCGSCGCCNACAVEGAVDADNSTGRVLDGAARQMAAPVEDMLEHLILNYM
eukprot:COSAG01_NODE_4719_length_4794_cov_4.909478_3_plen_586_part_00